MPSVLEALGVLGGNRRQATRRTALLHEIVMAPDAELYSVLARVPSVRDARAQGVGTGAKPGAPRSVARHARVAGGRHRTERGEPTIARQNPPLPHFVPASPRSGRWCQDYDCRTDMRPSTGQSPDTHGNRVISRKPPIEFFFRSLSRLGEMRVTNMVGLTRVTST